MGADPSAKLLAGSGKQRQQVAAVCYRVGKCGIEFLLVQTRGGRWIFPKGGVEPGLTAAQSAAQEAFEEAGVHGRMEAVAFARYFHRKPNAATARKNARPPATRSVPPGWAVIVHLCEVARLETPQESDRHPTWFCPEKAKRRLLQDRSPEFGSELARVIDRAVARIRRLHHESTNSSVHRHRDGLHEVRFEAHQATPLHANLRVAALIGDFFRQHRHERTAAAIEVALHAHLRKAHPIGALAAASLGSSSPVRRPILRLGSGSSSAADSIHKIAAIDGRRNGVGARPCPVQAGRAPASPRDPVKKKQAVDR